MSWIAWAVVGLLAGWIAGAITGSGRHGCLMNIAIGLIGALVGGLLASAFGLNPRQGFWAQLVVATVGAVVFLVVLNALRGRS